MVEADRSCPDVLMQVSAVQAALDKVALGLIDGHIGRLGPAEDARPAELMVLLTRVLRRT